MSLGKRLQNEGLSTKQVSNDDPYPGHKEALKESCKLLIRTQLQITTWRELTCIPIVKEVLVKKVENSTIIGTV